MGLLPLALTVVMSATPASPLLPSDHWAVKAAERLHELGLVPDWMPAQRAAPILAVARALELAAANAERDAPAHAAIARAWVARFHDEWPGVPLSAADADGREGSTSGAPALLGASLSLGFEGGSARVSAPPSASPSALLLTARASNP